MNKLIEWFARNGVAANLVAGLILIVGLLAIPNIKKTASEVLPNLRHIWDDEGWEDKWWPSGVGGNQQTPAPLQY